MAAVEEVPFVDLRRHHDEISTDLTAALEAVVTQNGFILGEETERFEAEFAAHCGARHCVGVNSGTAALALALMAAGIGPGDEVIVPAHTYIASALGVLHAGATPVLCDVRDDTGLLDPTLVQDLITPQTKAVMAVHLYGQPCDMTALSALAERNGLLLVEDAAQAHGARFEGAPVGSLGDIAGFSFYPSKNLGALGDGGAVCTNDDELAARVRRLRNLGQARKGEHLDLGFNERLDGLQAAFLRIKLRDLDAKNAERRRWAALYRELLSDAVVTLGEDPRGEPVYHLFPVRVRDRAAVQAALGRQGIQTGIHYHPAVHEQPPLAGVTSTNGGFPVAKRWSEEVLSLPMFPELTPAEVERVADVLGDAVDSY